MSADLLVGTLTIGKTQSFQTEPSSLLDGTGSYRPSVLALRRNLSIEQLDIVLGVKIGPVALPDRKGFTYFYGSALADNQSPRGRIDGLFKVRMCILCTDADAKASVIRAEKQVNISARGKAGFGVGTEIGNARIRHLNNNSETPTNMYVQVMADRAVVYEGFLKPPGDSAWWLDDALTAK